MNPLILLGAGASVDAKIRDAAGMTEQFVQLFSDDPELQKQSHAIRYVVGGLMLQKGAKGESPFDGVNIEEVFNAMHLLATRQLFEAAPFIAGWHPVVEELDVLTVAPQIKHEVSVTTQQVNCSIARKINDWIKEAVKNGQTSRDIGSECRRMVEESLRHLKSRVWSGGERPGEGRVFQTTCEKMIQKLVDLVWIRESERVQYLRPMVRYAARNRVAIATLNYDNTVELAAEQDGLSTFTGIGEPYLELSHDVHLFKLHGSIDWSREELASGDGCLPQTKINRAMPEKITARGYKPAVIFGHRNKLTAEGPYLGLLREFRGWLEAANKLIVIGYSFRDAHVNECIATWFNYRPERIIAIVTPDKDWHSRSAFAKCLSKISGRVEVISKTAGESIPSLFTE